MKFKRLIALAPFLAASLALSGCSAAPSTEFSEKTLELVVNDEAVGHTVRIEGLVRNFTDPTLAGHEGRELALVNVTVSVNAASSTPWGPDGSYLRDGDGENYRSVITPETVQAMSDAGYDAFANDSLKPGTSASGWIPYEVASPGVATLDFVTQHLNGSVKEQNFARIAG